MPRLDIVSLPSIQPEAAGAVVVIDVLRATTMIAALLDAGASFVLPVGSLEAARQQHAAHPEYVLAGERGGMPPPGFDLGNSPSAVTPEAVSGRGVVLTTTNGTTALETARRTNQIVLTLSLTNLDSVRGWLSRRRVDTCLMCSGTDMHGSIEDELAAGLFAAAMDGWDLTPRAVRIRDHALDSVERWGGAAGAVAQSPHTARLVELGFSRDVEMCSQISVTDCVPVMDLRRGVLLRG